MSKKKDVQRMVPAYRLSGPARDALLGAAIPIAAAAKSVAGANKEMQMPIDIVDTEQAAHTASELSKVNAALRAARRPR